MRRRIKAIFYISLGFFAIFSFRLFYLQVILGPRYLRFSNFQSIRRIITKAPRGRIFDRKGRVLGDVAPSFALSLIPREVDSLALRELGKHFPVDYALLEENRNSYSPVEIIANLPREKVMEIEERLFSLKGIRLEVKPLRYYPYPFFSHPLGYLSKITREELKRDATYRMDDFIGKAGIEKEYEKVLRGRDGMRMVEVDARGREVGPLPEVCEIRPVAGCDLYLSLDLELASLAESLFAPYEKGACVALDPNSGRVVLFYSKPNFDPNLFLLPLPKETWEAIRSNPRKPLFNRVTQAQFPPGSAFKPLVAFAALRRGLLSRERHFLPCGGSFRFGRRDFRCWATHGSLGLTDAIAQSCNTYFYQAGLATGLEEITSAALLFPFGRKSGLDLPEEAAGVLPTREYLAKRYKGKIPRGITLNLAIGQGEILVTPLQLALFYSAIAKRGVSFKPHLVDSIKFPCRIYRPPFLDSLPNFRPAIRGDDTIYIYAPKMEEIALPEEYIRVLEEALHLAVERGTGRGAAVSEIGICGKTGTAENPFGLSHAWFCGYAPRENPSLVVCVLVENVGKGGVYAAPIAQRIFQRYFEKSEGSGHK